MARHVEIIAHRGASHLAPENTLAAISLAWDLGADAVEIDVRLTGDGQVVVFHDETAERFGGHDQPIVEQTLAQLQQLDVGSWKGKQFHGERIPTLITALKTVPTTKRMLIELKAGPEIIPELRQVVTQAGKEPEQVALISFSIDALREAKQQLPANEAYLVARPTSESNTPPSQWDIDALVSAATQAELDGLNLSCEGHLTRTLVDQIHTAELKLCVWTVNSLELAHELYENGVDGITTDQPELLLDEFAK